MVSSPIAGYLPQVSTGYIPVITLTLYLALLAGIGGFIAGAFRK
jgi:hypothetical protein